MGVLFAPPEGLGSEEKRSWKALIKRVSTDVAALSESDSGVASRCWTCWNKAAPDAEGSGGRLKDRRPAPGTETGPEQEIHDRFRGVTTVDSTLRSSRSYLKWKVTEFCVRENDDKDN